MLLIFAYDMQIQVWHALCKEGCHLISYRGLRLIYVLLQLRRVFVPGIPYYILFNALVSVYLLQQTIPEETRRPTDIKCRIVWVSVNQIW